MDTLTEYQQEQDYMQQTIADIEPDHYEDYEIDDIVKDIVGFKNFSLDNE